jgi:hypothetical protein
MLTWYDQNWCHNVDFSVPVTTTKLRWTVTLAGYGDVPDINAATYAPFDFIDFPNSKLRLMCSEVLMIQGLASPGAIYGPFPA